MIKLEFTLEDPTTCDGCPANINGILKCRQGYVRQFARLTQESREEGFFGYVPTIDTKFIRPQMCIMDNDPKEGAKLKNTLPEGPNPVKESDIREVMRDILHNVRRVDVMGGPPRWEIPEYCLSRMSDAVKRMGLGAKK